jgi:5-methylcytosine-specific restriction endonuclease McrA
MHYARVKKYGSASISGSKTAGSLNGICRVADCGRLVLGLALCSVHYQRLKRYGTPTPESLRAKRTPGVTTCVVIGCGDPAGTRDMCSHHYQVALRYNGNPLGGKRRNLWHTVPDDAKCKAQGCERKPKSRGLCRPHYLQAQRNEDPLRFKIYGLKRRARLALGYVCDYTTEQVQARMDYWGNKCWMCGGPFECIDHVKPIKKLGKDCPANFRPACKSCNSAKSAKWYGNRELHRFVKS